MFKINPLYLSDGYKISHKAMLAKGTTKLYGTWIPRSTKHAPKGISKVVSFGQQMVWQYIHDAFEDNFFSQPKHRAEEFQKDILEYLGMEYNGKHFEELWDLGYLPIRVKSLPEGIETDPNIPHMTFVNTVDGFAWLTLYLETLVSSLAWKPSTSATIALQYRRNVEKAFNETCKDQKELIPFMCHDFSARGLNPHDMISSGLGHATSFRGSDTLSVIPAARYYYGEKDVCINSVNASEHSVSTTKIFTVGEKQMILDWCKEFPTGILSIVADTFDLWKLITEYLTDPEVKEAVLARDGKLVIRPDSGDPVDIVCGNAWRVQGCTDAVREKVGEGGMVYHYIDKKYYEIFTNQATGKPYFSEPNDILPEQKGVIELLWDIFGGTINKQGYKVLDSHIGAIYGDSITIDRQVQIYERLKAKGFAASNIVLGIGSFSYGYNSRDTLGWAAKGSWFEVEEIFDTSNSFSREVKSYNIYKDPVTDDGTKKSLKGLCQVSQDKHGEYVVYTECSKEAEEVGLLQTIYEDGKFHNQTTLTEVRRQINTIV
jgi:nicotinamide phosphoribosyltransferase